MLSCHIEKSNTNVLENNIIVTIKPDRMAFLQVHVEKSENVCQN